MKQKTLNLVLGVVALGLVSIVIVQQRKDEAKLAEPAKKGEPLSTLKADTIEHVALRHPGAPDILLERKDGSWNLVAPVQAPADSIEVGKLLAIATTETHGQLDAAKINRSDFGLDPAQFSLSLNDSQFAFGEIERLKYERYIEVDAGKPTDRVALIEDPDTSVVDADYTDLVSKKLLPPDADIARIELPDLKIERRDSGWVAQPAGQAATQAELQAFVDAWKRASAIRTESIGAAPDGTKTATITFADGSSRAFQIADREPQLVLDYAPLKVRYRFAPELSQQLLALPKPKPAPAATAPKPDVAPVEPKAVEAPTAAPK